MRTLSLFLAAVGLLWGALALQPTSAGASVEAYAYLNDGFVAGSDTEMGMQELELDDPLAPALAAIHSAAKSALHKPVEHFRTASAFEPDPPVPLSTFPMASLSTGADAPRASEVDRVQGS